MRVFVAIGLIAALMVSTIEGKSQGNPRDDGGPSVFQNKGGIHIYPNPTNEGSDFVNVNVGPFKATNVKLSLHNIIGNEIQSDVEVVDEHELRVRVKDLPSGYYLVTIKDHETGFRGTYKVLKR